MGSKTTPVGTYTMQWAIGSTQETTCGIMSEGQAINLACPNSQISAVSFASYGTPTGSCGTSLQKSKCNADITSYVQKECAGKSSCSVTCGNGECGSDKVSDPCYGTPKHIAVEVTCKGGSPTQRHFTVQGTVPHGAVADSVLPTF